MATVFPRALWRGITKGCILELPLGSIKLGLRLHQIIFVRLTMRKKPECYEFSTRMDQRGRLNFLEELKDVPFEVKRVYWLTGVPEQQVRGGHAHKTGEQVIVCIQGLVEVVLEDTAGELFTCTLSSPDQGLYIPPMWWGKMLFKEKAILLGLASDEFSEEDYIRQKADFK